MDSTTNGLLCCSPIPNNPKNNPALWLDLAFSGDEKIKLIDPINLAENISANIVNKCGLAIGLKSEKDIAEFKDYFVSIKNNIK